MVHERSISKSPYGCIEDEELTHAFYSFCTFCFLYYGKKINFATILFDYVYDYIRANNGKILCVRPINKMTQFVEKNKFKKIL